MVLKLKVLKLKVFTESSVKTLIAESSPRVSDLVGRKWCPRTCLFSKFRDNAAMAGSETTLGESVLQCNNYVVSICR